MGQFFTEFIMGLQNNPGANSSLAAYSSNALCNLIEFSEQRFLRDELNAGSVSSLLPNGSSANSSTMLVAAAAAQQQLNQQLNQQLIQHQQQLQHHHLQQFQQHFLQNIPPSLSASLQAQHLINSNNANGLQVNSSPGSNCSSPDAISQLSSTIKSEDHSNHSYLSEIRDTNAIVDKARILNQLNPIELALNANVQKQLSGKTSLNKNELKFSVRSILSEENAQNGNPPISGGKPPGNQTDNSSNANSSNSSKQSINSAENGDRLKSDKASTQSIKIPKKERNESPSKVRTSESFSSSSSASSSPSPQTCNKTAVQQPNHELKTNQQQSVKTIERRLVEKGMCVLRW